MLMPKHGEDFRYQEERANDPVNHPEHYTYGKIECIDFLEAIGVGYDFCVGNAIKYLVRARHKGTQLQDLRKAAWYIQRAIGQVEAQEEAGQ